MGETESSDGFAERWYDHGDWTGDVDSDRWNHDRDDRNRHVRVAALPSTVTVTETKTETVSPSVAPP